jgi:hypothetical protein
VSPPNRGSPGVTAVIAAHDESANIEACIASLDAGVFFKPPAQFVSMHLLKGGFRDGARGLVLASLAAASVMAKHPHLLECRSAMNTEIRALL